MANVDVATTPVEDFLCLPNILWEVYPFLPSKWKITVYRCWNTVNMSWLGSGISQITGQISNFTKEVLTEGTEEVDGMSVNLFIN